jgi:hypothetical protein
VGSGWKISLSPNGEQLLITREDRSLIHLRSARDILEGLTDVFMFKLDSNGGRPQFREQQKRLTNFSIGLKEYNTSRPAISVSSEATSSSCVMS